MSNPASADSPLFEGGYGLQSAIIYGALPVSSEIRSVYWGLF
jgi:hypothetical protein